MLSVLKEKCRMLREMCYVEPGVREIFWTERIARTLKQKRA